MKQRGTDRRWRAKDTTRLAPDRRDGFDRRAGLITGPLPGAIRPGFGEAAPRVERRRVPGNGME